MEDTSRKDEIWKKMDFKDVADKWWLFQRKWRICRERNWSIKVTFKLYYNSDLNGKEFSDTSKEGQDLKYIKYKLIQI